MDTITFERSSKLERIGERALYGCKLDSSTIPPLTEEMDGLAFLDCPLVAIRVVPDNVKHFGLSRDIHVGKEVKFFRKPCFEGSKQLDEIYFEREIELERIDGSALRDWLSLVRIDIPASVEILEETSFEGCDSLESCMICEY
jgi:hypothetical protein